MEEEMILPVGRKWDFFLKAGEVAHRMGVSEAEVDLMRQEHLEMGVDYEKNHRWYRYNEGAVMKLMAVVAPVTEEAKAVIVEKAEEVVLGVPVVAVKELVVVVKRVINPNILMAQRANGELVRVRVRSNANFGAGMGIEAEHVEADLWRYSGKLPRRLGKW